MRCGNSEPPIESQLDGPSGSAVRPSWLQLAIGTSTTARSHSLRVWKGVGTPVSSQLSEPPEFLFHHEGCSVYRFEYYGWHYYADCGDWQEPPRESSKLEQPVEFLLEYDGCTGYRFEYYGWHYLTHCPETRLASSRRRALVRYGGTPLFPRRLQRLAIRVLRVALRNAVFRSSRDLHHKPLPLWAELHVRAVYTNCLSLGCLVENTGVEGPTIPGAV